MKQLEEVTNIMKKMAEVQKAEDTVDRVKWEILLEKLNEINEKLDGEDCLDERIFELEYLLDTAGEEIDRLRRKNKKLKKKLKKYEDVI